MNFHDKRVQRGSLGLQYESKKLHPQRFSYIFHQRLRTFKQNLTRMYVRTDTELQVENFVVSSLSFSLEGDP